MEVSKLKRVISFLMVTVLVLGMALPAAAAPQSWGSVYTMAEANAPTSRSNMLTVGGANYIFVPGNISLEAVPLYFSLPEGSSVTAVGSLGQASLFSGGAINLKALCGEGADCTVTLKAPDASDLKLTFIPTQGIGSMFLVSDDPINEDRLWVESSPDKSNKATGSMYYCDAEGTPVYNGTLTQIKGRGNSTWLAEKKPYQIKLKDKTDLLQTGNDENRSKTWVLLTNHSDTTSIRNNIVYDMSVAAGLKPGIQCEPVNLYYDGEYRGTYLLCEKVEIGSGRVDVNDLEGDNEDANPTVDDFDDLEVKTGKTANGATYIYCEGMQTPDNYTGGYLLEMDTAPRAMAEKCYFITTHGYYIVVKSPEYCSKTEMDYIASYYQDFEDTVYNGGIHPENGKTLADYATLESLAQCYIINEWTKNPDGYRTSSYFYKDADSDIMTVGPIWDYDLSFGSSWGEFVAPCAKPEGYFTLYSNFAGQLYKIGAFRQAVHDSYLGTFSPLIEETLLAESSNSGLLQSISGYQAELAPSAKANGIIWNRSEAAILDNTAALRSYITTRSAWLKEAFGSWNSETIAPLNTYIDVEESDWFYDIVIKATDYGILNGMNYSIFAPTGQTTRAQAAKVLYAISGDSAPEYKALFKDVHKSNWFAGPVLWAAENGVVKGMDDGTFLPDTPITRQDMVVLLYRYLGSPETSKNTLSNFADGSTVSAYAASAMQWAVENGVIEGYEDGAIRPFNRITRAEMAALIVRYYENFVMAGEEA